MNLADGNIYGPDDDFPDDAVMVELLDAERAELMKQREKDAQKVLRRVQADRAKARGR